MSLMIYDKWLALSFWKRGDKRACVSVGFKALWWIHIEEIYFLFPLNLNCHGFPDTGNLFLLGLCRWRSNANSFLFCKCLVYSVFVIIYVVFWKILTGARSQRALRGRSWEKHPDKTVRTRMLEDNGRIWQCDKFLKKNIVMDTLEVHWVETFSSIVNIQSGMYWLRGTSQ